MKISKLFPSRFFRGDDFDDGPMVLTIKDVKIEMLGGANDEQKEKAIAHFVGATKALVINVTNAGVLANLSDSDDSDDWVGLTVELYQEKIRMHGKTIPCVRVRQPSKKSTKGAAAEDSAPPVDQDDSGDTDGDNVPETWEDEPVRVRGRK